MEWDELVKYIESHQYAGVIVAGCFGGMVSIFIKDHDKPNGTTTGYFLYFLIFTCRILRDAIVGGTAAFGFWAILSISVTSPEVYGVAVLSGLGGAQVLDYLFVKEFSEIKSERADLTTSAKNYREIIDVQKQKIDELIQANVDLVAKLEELTANSAQEKRKK